MRQYALIKQTMRDPIQTFQLYIRHVFTDISRQSQSGPISLSSKAQCSTQNP